jgi:hypothetical protein
MERMTVFILFLIFNLARIGPVGSPPDPGIKPEAKVIAIQATVKKVKLPARPMRLAGEETVNEDLTSQG